MKSLKWLAIIALDILILMTVFFIAFNVFVLADLYLAIARGVEVELGGIGHFIFPFFILFALGAIWLLAKIRSKFLQVELDSRFHLLLKISLIGTIGFVVLFIIIPLVGLYLFQR